MSVLVVIPARLGSSRFPGKPLATLWGQPLIQSVYQAASQCSSVDRVVVATDNLEIQHCVLGFHGDVMLTDASARTGTDRVAEVASRIPADVIVNIQGDEVLLDTRLLDDLIEPFLRNAVSVGTLRRRMTELDHFHNPNVVKVVVDHHGKALYFSRSAIPFHRESGNHVSAVRQDAIYEHVGVYIYRQPMLHQFATMGTGTLEAAEGLEQLRVIEAGMVIQTWETTYPSLRIDTPADLAHADAIPSPISERGAKIRVHAMNTKDVR